MQNVTLIGIDLGEHSFHVHVHVHCQDQSINQARHFCAKSSHALN
ncbi:putative transposase [Yersinia similis]|uniref:Putative transposase n=1 Tax=Yersinia similis TaxID=367190 RepID=A0A0T9RSB6_9GAMM|nr:putative transposase [Yersinia similis]